MSKTEPIETIPAAPVVKARLEAATAEVRYLRRLLKLARQRDESRRLRKLAFQKELDHA